jgi:hypothetical protein
LLCEDQEAREEKRKRKGLGGRDRDRRRKAKRLKGGLVLERETKRWSFKSRGEGAIPVRVPEAGKKKKKIERGV